MENARRRGHGTAAGMSTFTRYAFSLLICLYGIYQITADHMVPGVIAILLAVFIFWIGQRR
jgi:hypothetical protein